ncbi:MAG: HD domain-containing protein [bacterium]|nr:HD domain-containing protein [bacterium]
MLNKRTQKIIDFLKEIEKLKLVWRVNYLTDQKTREDDAQHSWHLAMMILVFADELKVKFSVEHTIKLALVHDIGEIHTGDSWSLKPDKKQKHADEDTAIKKVLSILPKDLQKELYNLWLEYENGQTVEAKVAKAFDKIIYSVQYAAAKKIEWDQRTSIYESRQYALPYLEFEPKLIEILDELLKEAPEYYEPAEK